MKSDPWPETIYYEFLIALGEEEHFQVQCVATFRKGDDFGKAQKLPAGYKLFLDDQEMPFDPEVYPCYSKEADRKGFDGPHEWKLTGPSSTVLTLPFVFRTFQRTSDLPDTLGTVAVDVGFKGLPDGEELLFWFDNTDMGLDDDRFHYTIRNGRVTIPVADLRKLKPAPYNLKIYYDQASPVIINGKERGKSEVSYILTDIPVVIKF